MVQAVIPESLIAERRRLGLDKKDEVWEGELHMNLPGGGHHQVLEARLVVALAPVARARQLFAVPEIGVFDPDVPEYKDFRTPDVVVCDPALITERGVEGGAALVIEIRSPHDDSFKKFPFYSRVGVGEMLIIDRDTKDVRRWLPGPDGLAEEPADAVGWHRLSAVPVALQGGGGHLRVETDHGIEVM